MSHPLRGRRARGRRARRTGARGAGGGAARALRAAGLRAGRGSRPPDPDRRRAGDDAAVAGRDDGRGARAHAATSACSRSGAGSATRRRSSPGSRARSGASSAAPSSPRRPRAISPPRRLQRARGRRRRERRPARSRAVRRDRRRRRAPAGAAAPRGAARARRPARPADRAERREDVTLFRRRARRARRAIASSRSPTSYSSAAATDSRTRRDARAVIRLALAGDTMLGRRVGRARSRARGGRRSRPRSSAVAAEADLFVLNLECCISDRGERWPEPGKPFFFRAPPCAAELLAGIGVDCVTLANNHALDFGPEALLDTLDHLRAAGIAAVGAGPDVAARAGAARARAGGLRLAVLGASDHPADFAAAADRPGIAYADLRADPCRRLARRRRRGRARRADAVLVTPHWGPNMTARPPPHVRRAARALLAAGADARRRPLRARLPRRPRPRPLRPRRLRRRLRGRPRRCATTSACCSSSISTPAGRAARGRPAEAGLLPHAPGHAATTPTGSAAASSTRAPSSARRPVERGDRVVAGTCSDSAAWLRRPAAPGRRRWSRPWRSARRRTPRRPPGDTCRCARARRPGRHAGRRRRRSPRRRRP